MVEKLNEGYTEWGPQASIPWQFPSGYLGRFFGKFFGNKAREYMYRKYMEPTDPNVPSLDNPMDMGDAIKYFDPAYTNMAVRSPAAPEIEVARRERYKAFEKMDAYPEISTAFDIYADECTQKNTKGDLWSIKSKSDLAKEEVEELFETIDLDKVYWDIFRNMVKYGDCFVELVVDLKKPSDGIKRVKILNPIFMYRRENEYGQLVEFLQEIPDKNDWNNYNVPANFGVGANNQDFITLDRNQIVHFRLHTSDPTFAPYGKSIASSARRVYESLVRMEDAMLIYRLSRAPERRVHYIDIGNLPQTKAELFIQRQIEKLKKQHYVNPIHGTVDQRYNPLSMDEDYFIPVRGNNSASKIDTLQGAQNLGEVDDVKYFRDKLLSALKIPKDYIVEFDKSPERKANLAQLDVKFARTIMRVQQSGEAGLVSVAKRHLQLKGYPSSVIRKLKVKLPEPSDIFIKRKMDVEEQKLRVVQTLLGLGIYPRDWIYKEYWDMSPSEIKEAKKLIEKDMQEQAEMQASMAMMMPGAMPGMGGGGGGMSADPNAPNQMPGMPATGAGANQPGYSEAGGPGIEGRENSTNEGLNALNSLKLKLLREGKETTVIDRAIRRLKKSDFNKNKTESKHK